MAQCELKTGQANFEFLSLGSSYEWKLKSGTAGAGGLNNKMLQQTKTIDAKNWKTHPKWNWKKYMRSENLKLRAFIWDQSQLRSSIRSRVISRGK